MKSTLILGFLFAMFSSCSGENSSQDSLEIGNKRVRVENNTVVTWDGKLIRSASMSIGRDPSRQAITSEMATWQAVKDRNLNCVRLAVHKQRSDKNGAWPEYIKLNHGKPPYPAFPETDEIFFDLDERIKLAEQLGLYVLLDFHFIGQYDIDELKHFWNIASERYKNKEHVFFEICNEPVAWRPEHYLPEDLRAQEELYRIIRSKAPDTHIVLLSFAHPDSKTVNDATMKQVTDQLQGIDWKNASVGFHPYNKTGSSAAIVELKAHYPCIATEIQIDSQTNDAVDPLDGDRYPVQTFERLRISWACWTIGDMPPQKGWNVEWDPMIVELQKLGIYPWKD